MEKVTLVASGEPAEWDLLAPQFRKAIHGYLHIDELTVELLVPNGITDEDLYRTWCAFLLGVSIGCYSPDRDTHVAVQASRASEIITLASRSEQAVIPGPKWHQSDALVVDFPISTCRWTH